ncbi:class I SAM-dependent DNA methyltransferase [Actinophytocola xanthii]|uniref:SAM-dependent methyltransferase n=1 Tax=Actinophytocola xanthii TaxID=1912961 RepID=A0A1Q8CS54_9PSEU|nr:class I SAM-dependent methyltransferase [Actinophytocola xanthii]OLF17180.1 SAM-dependent methyltransferase [Actinophytocola xanthii]
MTAIPAPAGTQYGRRQADIYDAVYGSRGKDWSAEADTVAALVRSRCPDATSVLDVACGTGNHLRRLVELFDRADGLELSVPMGDIARAKVGWERVHTGDMRGFDLGRVYDAVLCMCFSIAYATSTDELCATLRCLAAHTAPDGVVVVEPWWFPERFRHGYVTASAVVQDGRAITRLSHSVRDGDTSRMTIRYTVADAEGIEDFTECEVHSLFTRDQYLTAFDDAGLRAEYREGGPSGRGLFVAAHG